MLDESKFEVEYKRDVRVQMVATLIKAAHLTMFELLGYNYALRAAGEYIGHQILGKFFIENKGKSRSEVALAAHSHFREFATMVRPIFHPDFEPQGTIEDNYLHFCVGGSGQYWAMIVFVKTGEMVHGVLLPTFDTVDTISTFLDFLQNENEEIHVSNSRFNVELSQWEIAPKVNRLTWPKKGTLYPENSDSD
ncbi:MAG: hypothetical protein EOP06_30170 [Proteobacteria bacterium]|nr:MAG: hypothetical protein EOP06_30170 [Pseudomonadota bacterium]